jgi:hypothetical protein
MSLLILLSDPAPPPGEIARVTRYGVEVLADLAAFEARATRYGIEVLGRPDIQEEATTQALRTIDFMYANWQAEVELEQTFETRVFTSDNGTEDRVSLRHRPERYMSIQWTGMNKVQSTKLRMNLMRMANAQFLAPIYCDSVNCTVATDTLTGDFQYRRFFVGGRALVTDGTSFEEFPILAVSDTEVQLDGSPTITVTRAFPLMECEIQLSASGTQITEHHSNVLLNLQEANPLPLIANIFTPTLYEGDPVLQLPCDWSQVAFNIRRYGATYVEGKGKSVEVYGQPEFALNFRALGMNRANAWGVISAFEHCRGRKNRLWIIDKQSVFNVTNVSGVVVTVDAQGSITDFDFFTHLASSRTDIHEVVSVTDNGSTWDIEFDDDMTGVTDLFLARYGRFDSDSLSESWKTQEHCEFSLSFTTTAEVPVTGVLDFPNPTVVSSQLPQQGVLWGWWDAAVNVTKDGTTEPELAETLRYWEDVRGGRRMAGDATPLPKRILAQNGRLAVGAEYNSGTHNKFRLDEHPDWSNGFTIFVVRRQVDSATTAQDQLLYKLDEVEWHYHDIQIGGVVFTPTNVSSHDRDRILVLRYKPSTSIYLWVNGGDYTDLFTASVPAAPSTTANTLQIASMVKASAGVDDLDTNRTLQTLLYLDHLSLQEIDQVGSYLAGLNGLNWTNANA